VLESECGQDSGRGCASSSEGLHDGGRIVGVHQAEAGLIGGHVGRVQDLHRQSGRRHRQCGGLDGRDFGSEFGDLAGPDRALDQVGAHIG
jgi:hypothetical protein